jgi:hypothetical protein
MKVYKFVSFLLVFSLISFYIHGQQASYITIKGVVQDTSLEVVPAATVMLLNYSDSTLVNYTTTNSLGAFSFKNVKNSDYLLKLSHISYMPWQVRISPTNESVRDLGVITVDLIAEILMEVVIKSAQAPLFIHGDTVEYDARLFKIPPGSTVEDLLRRLPGIDVDASGNVSTQGKDVKRIYVDGKTFFSDDPTSVTKNLDAQAISKVQVYDDKSEQERLTGIADGNEDKVMNLELKDEYKKGFFGKASIAGGTDERYAGRASFNRFTEKQQISFIGYGNNVNQTGVNWDDYSEFKGNSAYSDYDNGDFGFSLGGGYRFYSGSGGMDYFDGKGFTKNYGGGLNYNYFDKKTTFNASYFYNQTDLDYDLFSNRQTFLTDTAFLKTDTLAYGEFRSSHGFSTRAEIAFDSCNTLILRVNARISGNQNVNHQNQLFQTLSMLEINQTTINNSSELDAYSINSLGIYRHKFKKKGRTFAISGAYDLSDNTSHESIYNLNRFFSATTTTEQISILNDNASNSSLAKSSLLYVEPISKRFSLMGFYNLNSSEKTSGKLGYNPLSSNNMVDSLSLFYNHTILYNRLGSSFNYNYEGVNISIGGAYQIIGLSGEYSTIEGSPLLVPELTKTYKNFVPNFSANVQLPNNMHFNLEYSYDITAPDISYLQPVPDYSNSLYQSIGNPELYPERNHNIDASFNYWNQASFTNVSIGSTYNIYDNRIVYNQNTTFVDSVGYVTIMKPENVLGGSRFSTYIWSGFPIIKTKLTMNLSGWGSLDESPAFVNGVKNITTSDNYAGQLGFNLTLGPKLTLNLQGGLGRTNVKYSIQTNQNQKITNFQGLAGVKWQFFKKTFLEANYNLNSYRNTMFVYDADLQSLNISVRQILGKSNKFEIRLAAIDLLNQNLYIMQNAQLNYFENISSPSLARYFMLSVSYNIKGFETKVKNERW